MMTVDEARGHAARVLKKAEKATEAPLMAELTSVANTWLRLAQDVQWSEEAAQDRAEKASEDEPGE